MTEQELELLRYPIGRFSPQEHLTDAERSVLINNIKSFPQRLTGVITELNEEQLNTPYRPEGWTVRQLVHHIADSHVNSYIRFRWTLTEDTPTIKAYEQADWAELPDAKNGPVNLSLNILKAIHSRWVLLMERMTSDDFSKELGHPEWKKNLSLDFMVQMYSWHCDHHLTHITALIHREGW